MSSFVNTLFSDFSNYDASSSKHSVKHQNMVFHVRASRQSSTILLVHLADQAIDASSLYYFTTSKKEVGFFKGNPVSGTEIGTAVIHQWSSSSADITLRGQPVKLEISANSGHTKVELPSLGKLRWKLDYNTMSGLILVDESGGKIAKYGSAGSLGTGGKMLEFLLSVTETQAEEIMFAAVVAKGVNKAADEVAFKVLKAFVF